VGEKVINGERYTRDSIVEAHKKLVYHVAHRYRKMAEMHDFELDDIASVAFIGLLKAYDKFDGDKYKVRFSTYAVPMIVGEIRRYLRDNNIGVKFNRATKELAARITKNELEQLPIDIIALELDSTEEKVFDAIQYIYGKRAKSTNAVVYADDGDDITLEDQIGRNEDYSTVMVNEFLDSLSNKERIVAEELLKGRLQREIAPIVGTSQVQVSRIIAKLRLKYQTFMNVTIDQNQTGRIQVMKQAKGDLKRAKSLLREGKHTIEEIAEMTGANKATLKTYYYTKVKPKQAESKPIKTVQILSDEERKQKMEATISAMNKSKDQGEIKRIPITLTPAQKEHVAEYGLPEMDRPKTPVTQMSEDLIAGIKELKEQPVKLEPRKPKAEMAINMSINSQKATAEDIRLQVEAILVMLESSGLDSVSFRFSVFNNKGENA
jgi:RNA polymerase sigma factor (sigma-70 family)